VTRERPVNFQSAPMPDAGAGVPVPVPVPWLHAAAASTERTATKR
jgi:hypothetical protein